MKVAVFGAGITGLAAARHLARSGHSVDVYEASDHIGGLASTFRSDDGFVYDNGPRFILSTLAEKIGIADRCEPVKYYEDMRIRGRHYLFPFGFARNPLFAASVGSAMITRQFKRKPRNLREFLTTYYGSYFSNRALIPLIEKWAGIPAHEVSIDFASRLLPTNISYILYSILKRLRRGVTEDYYKGGRYIVYPRGSNSVIFDELKNHPDISVHLDSPISALNTSGNRILAARIGSKEVRADAYLSTIPVNDLSRQLGESMSQWQSLNYRSILILFVKIARPKLLPYLWTWFPEKIFPFYRISEFKNALPDLAPKDKTLISIEIACQTTDPIWTDTGEKVFERVSSYLADLYGLKPQEVIGLDLRRSAHAYPVMAIATEEIQRQLTHQTPFQNLFIAGRTGQFQYRMTEASYDSGISAAEMIHSFLCGSEILDRRTQPDRDAYGRPNVVPE